MEGRPRQLQRHVASTACRSSRRCRGDRNLGMHEIGGEQRDRPHPRCSSTSAPTPAQQIALVAMANELSKGTRRHDRPGHAGADPVRRSRQRDQRVAPNRSRSTSTSHLTHDPTCGAMQWFHPFASMDACDDGRGRPERCSPARRSAPSGATRTSARRSSARSATNALDYEPAEDQKAAREKTPFLLRGDLRVLRALVVQVPSCHGPHQQSRADHRRQAHRRRRRARAGGARRGRRAQLRALEGRSRGRPPARVRAAGRRGGDVSGRSRRSPTPRAALVQRTVGHLRPPRHPDQHGVGLRAEAVRRADRRRLGRGDQRRSARGVPLRARRRAAHAEGRAAGASSTSATGSRAAAGRATKATCRTTSPRPASSR